MRRKSMSNFSDYIKSSNDTTNSKSTGSGHNKVYSEEYLNKLIEDYSKQSKDSLVNEFMKLTIEKKKRGELTHSDIERLKATLSPMLNNEQRENLEKLMQVVENV